MDQSKADIEPQVEAPYRPMTDFEIRGTVLSYTQYIMATGLGQIMEPEDVIKLARQLYNFMKGMDTIEIPKSNSSNVSKFPS
jgi:hypothetical protein